MWWGKANSRAAKSSKKPKRAKAGAGAPVRAGWRRATYWGAVAGIWSIVAGMFFILYLAHDLPDLGNLPVPAGAERIEVRGNDGRLIATYGAVYGDWLDFEQIPDALVNAVVAIEDRRFFSHSGVDARAVGRALFANVSAGRIRQGASTITQQLAKNLYLSPERTLKRKAQELLLAAWIETRFSKETILTIYLNRIYFGGGTYGIDAAAQKFFGHSARRLSLGEAALLAGLIQAPSLYAPSRSADRAYGRMADVLTALVDEGYITPDEAGRLKDVPPPIAPGASMLGNRYFTDWVIERARALVAGEGQSAGQSLVIYTSLDPNVQAAAERALRRNLKADDSIQGAVVALTTEGAVVAMVGGKSYATSQFNRATAARRQPGSAFKPIVYMAGLEAGLKPDAQMEDRPVTIDGWTPRNYSGQYLGPVSLTEAFAKSINTVAVQISEFAGRARVAEAARRLGIESEIRAHPSLALGSSEVTPVELTAAYAAIANGGFRVRPYAILEVRDISGQLIYRRQPALGLRVIDESVASQLTGMMQAVITEGTGKAARLDRPAAGKTGTSQDFRDAWFLGFTSDIIAGVWVGNDDNKPMSGVTGGGLPARIWSDFMVAAHLGAPPRPLHLEAGRFDSAAVKEKSGEAPVKKPGFFDRLFRKKN